MENKIITKTPQENSKSIYLDTLMDRVLKLGYLRLKKDSIEVQSSNITDVKIMCVGNSYISDDSGYSIIYKDVSGEFQDVEVSYFSTPEEREHIKNILEDSTQRRKALEFLNAVSGKGDSTTTTTEIGGCFMIIFGIILVVGSIWLFNPFESIGSSIFSWSNFLYFSLVFISYSLFKSGFQRVVKKTSLPIIESPDMTVESYITFISNLPKENRSNDFEIQLSKLTSLLKAFSASVDLKIINLTNFGDLNALIEFHLGLRRKNSKRNEKKTNLS
jgi:hypothetical protein